MPANGRRDLIRRLKVKRVQPSPQIHIILFYEVFTLSPTARCPKYSFSFQFNVRPWCLLQCWYLSLELQDVTTQSTV